MSRALPNYHPNRLQQGLLYGTGRNLDAVLVAGSTGGSSDDLPRDIESSGETKVSESKSTATNGYINPRMATMLQVRRDLMKRD